MTVSVIGCGWLGLPLAKALVVSGRSVIGSTQAKVKSESLLAQGIVPVLCEVSEQGQVHCANDMLFQVETVIITLPFRRAFEPASIYFEQCQALLKKLQEYDVCRRVIFTSSTSIYPRCNSEVSESAICPLESERQRVLFECEQLFLTAKGIDACVLRLGGLYGKDRRIGHFLSGKSVTVFEKEPVNLVHQDDVVGVIMALLEKEASNDVFNVICSDHPSKGELYRFHCQQDGIQCPDFDSGDDFLFKRVSNKKIVTFLSYSFLHPTLLSTYD